MCHFLLFLYIADKIYSTTNPDYNPKEYKIKGQEWYAGEKSGNLTDFWSHTGLLWMRTTIPPALCSDRKVEKALSKNKLVKQTKRNKRPLSDIAKQTFIYDGIMSASRKASVRRKTKDNEITWIRNMVIHRCISEDLRGARGLLQCLWVLSTYHVHFNKNYDPFASVIFTKSGNIITNYNLKYHRKCDQEYNYICTCGKYKQDNSSVGEIINKEEFSTILKEKVKKLCAGRGSIDGVSKDKQRKYNKTFPGLI